MAKSHGSVRMGPISLFALIIILCLAVMAVLAVTTAQATYALTQRQGTAAAEAYQAETAAQRFMGALDAELAAVHAADLPPNQTLAAVEQALQGLCEEAVAATADADGAPVAIEAEASIITSDKAANLAGIVGVGRTGGPLRDVTPVEGMTPLLDDKLGAVHAAFVTDGGHALDVIAALCDDGTYEILSWKATTLWNEEGAGETLWSGSPSLG